MKRRSFEQVGSVAFKTTNTAVLLWRSMQANYRFVSCLNHFYDIQLWREEELQLPIITPRSKSQEVIRLPFWSCFDETSQLFYTLLDVEEFKNEFGKLFESFDKVLFVYGEDCWVLMKSIYNQFTKRPSIPDSTNLLEVDKYQLLQSFRQTVIQVDYFDGRHPDMIESSMLVGDRNRYAKKYLDEMDALNEILLDMLAAIEINLSKNEEENSC